MARTGLVVATPVIGQRTGAGETRAPERRGAAPASVVGRGLHGANAYSAVSMLVVRLATDETAAWPDAGAAVRGARPRSSSRPSTCRPPRSARGPAGRSARSCRRSPRHRRLRRPEHAEAAMTPERVLADDAGVVRARMGPRPPARHSTRCDAATPSTTSRSATTTIARNTDPPSDCQGLVSQGVLWRRADTAGAALATTGRFVPRADPARLTRYGPCRSPKKWP